MPPENLSTPTAHKDDKSDQDHQHHHYQQQQHHPQQYMSQTLVEQPAHGLSGGAMSDPQGHGGGHHTLEHTHSMAEHAAHSMLDLSETTGNSLEHLASGGGGAAGHASQSLAELAHRGGGNHDLEAASRRQDLMDRSGSAGGPGSGSGGSLTPTLHQMSQGGDARDLSVLTGSSSGASALLSRPMSGHGLAQPMRNLTPVGGVLDGRVDTGGRGSGNAGANNTSSSALSFSPDPQHPQPVPSHQRVPIIPKRGRPPGSGSSQHSLANIHRHNTISSSSSSSHHQHHQSHHSSHHNSNQAPLHMRGLSDQQHHNLGDNGGTGSTNGRGLYGLDGGQQLNSRPGSVLMSEPDSRDLSAGRGGYSNASSADRNPTSSSSTSLIEETIAAVASNFNRSSPNSGIMAGPLPPNSHHHQHNLMSGGLSGLRGDDHLADLVSRGHTPHGIPMLSERASQSLSGLMDDGGDGHSGLHPGGSHLGSSGSSHHGGREIEKTHPCLTCLKMFRSKQQLAQHSLVHTGIRKHICTFCDRAFKQLSHLQQHVRIHTGERKYMCKFCDRGFKQLSHLQKHITVHTEAAGDGGESTTSSAAVATTSGSSSKGKRGRKPKNPQQAVVAVQDQQAGTLAVAPPPAPPPQPHQQHQQQPLQPLPLPPPPALLLSRVPQPASPHHVIIQPSAAVARLV